MILEQEYADVSLIPLGHSGFYPLLKLGNCEDSLHAIVFSQCLEADLYKPAVRLAPQLHKIHLLVLTVPLYFIYNIQFGPFCMNDSLHT